MTGNPVAAIIGQSLGLLIVLAFINWNENRKDKKELRKGKEKQKCFTVRNNDESRRH